MSVTTDRRIDPAAECVRFLAMRHAYPDGEPRTITYTAQKLCRRYNLPENELEQLTEPLRALEEDMAAALEPRQELWEDMFYPGSDDENLLAWSFYMLERSGCIQEMGSLECRQRLIREMLSLSREECCALHDVDSLITALERSACSTQAKWICLRTWRDPRPFYDKYRSLVELTVPVLAQHQASLQPLADRAVERAADEARGDMEMPWKTLGTARVKDELLVAPLCIDFNGMGICWDDTLPDPALEFVGVLYGPIRDLIRSCGGRTQLLSDQLKSIADPRRMDILMALKNGSLCGQELAEMLRVTPGTVSHHMSSLVGTGFVSINRSGTKINYALQRQKLASFIDQLHLALLE